MGDDRPCGSGIPQQIFSSKEEGHEALIAHAYANGYSLTKHQQYPRGGDPTRITYRCGKGRSYTQRENHTHESKRRKTASQMTGCPFKLNLRRRDSGWVVEYIIQHGGRPLTAHNHGWIQASAFPQFRNQGIAAYRDEIVAMRNSGMRPREIVARLQNPEVPDRRPIAVTAYDIMNLLARYCRDELGGKTPVEWRKGKPRGRSAAKRQSEQVDGDAEVHREAQERSPSYADRPDRAGRTDHAQEEGSRQDAIAEDAEHAPESRPRYDGSIDDGGGGGGSDGDVIGLLKAAPETTDVRSK